MAPEETVEDAEFLMSNRGACDFLVKADGKMRPFELTQMYVGLGDLTVTVVFLQVETVFMKSFHGRKLLSQCSTRIFLSHYPQCVTVVFLQFLTTVRGKLCWNIVYRDDVISEDEAKIYVECIQEVLNENELE